MHADSAMHQGSRRFYGFKRDLNAHLATLGPVSMVHSLSEAIAFNDAHAAVALKYGQTSDTVRRR